MVLLKTSEEWQKQTSLLLEARPTSARITTKYNIPNLEAPKYQKSNKRKRDAAHSEATDGEKGTAPRVPRATLVLKTFCPESGVVLQYKTDRAQEVGRLIASLGRMGRHMAALPDVPEDAPMEDAPSAEVQAGDQATKSATAPSVQATQAGGGGGSSKKKKKGRK